MQIFYCFLSAWIEWIGHCNIPYCLMPVDGLHILHEDKLILKNKISMSLLRLHLILIPNEKEGVLMNCQVKIPLIDVICKWILLDIKG